jgi:uncharacterized protein YbjT (DUF2867 family)
MELDMYTVIGATGNTGRVVAENLLAAGQRVRVVGRSEERLAGFVEAGAEPAVGDVADAGFVASACDGAGGVYCMIPPRYDIDLRAWQEEVGVSLGRGIRESGVPYIVNLSSIGAQHPAGTGPIVALRRMESRLNELTEANVLHLRPTWFMENFFMNLASIREMGVLAMAMAGDVPVPMIATRDIGEVAARRLAALDFEGHHVQELIGPREYTLQEAAEIIGAAIGEPGLPFVQISFEETEQGLASMGVHPGTIDAYIEMYRGAAQGLLAGEEPRSAANTTPTTLEEFAGALAAVYNA